MLGAHSATSQKRKILAIGVAVGVVILVAVIVWQTGAQKPVKRSYTAVSGTQTTVGSESAPTVPAQSTTTTILAPKISKSAGSGGIVAHSSNGTTGTPPAADSPTTPIVTSTTATTVASGIAGTPQTVTYAAYVDPRFHQDPTNPLKVTYSYSASASTTVDGVSLQLSSLSVGTLNLSANGNQMCSMNVGGAVASGTCVTTFAAFGTEAIVATYTTGGSDYSSDTASDDVEPFATTTVASIHGGGSLGGLEFDANVTDSNGNAVTTGTITMTVGDSTQGWGYSVTVANVGADGGNPNAFSCLLIENYPRVGEYSGCGLSGQIQRSPATNDDLTVVASFTGPSDWTNSQSSLTGYSMPS